MARANHKPDSRRSLGAELIVSFVAASLFTMATAQGGAWPQDKGDLLVIARMSYDRAAEAFDDAGEPDLARDFHKIEGGLYAEYGLTNRITVVVSPVAQFIRDRDGLDARQAFGLAATDFGLRTRIWQSRRYVVSVQPLVSVPGTLGQSTNLALASGQYEGELRALGGVNFAFFGLDGFVNAEAAYRYRSGPRADETRADLTVGLDLAPDWRVMGQSFSTIGLDDFALHKAQLSVVYRMTDHLSLETGVMRGFVGRNVIREQALFASLWVRF